jgi:hypothetical protein
VPFPTTTGSMSFYAAGVEGLPVSFFYTGLDEALFPPRVVEKNFPAYASTTIPEWLGFNAMSMVAVSGAHYESGTVLSDVTPILIAALDTNAAAGGQVTLLAPHPNPIRPDVGEASHFELVLTSPTDVFLDVFSLSGDRIHSVIVENAVGGVSLFWDGTNDAGRPVASGLYLCKLSVGTTEKVFRVGVVR